MQEWKLNNVMISPSLIVVKQVIDKVKLEDKQVIVFIDPKLNLRILLRIKALHLL